MKKFWLLLHLLLAAVLYVNCDVNSVFYATGDPLFAASPAANGVPTPLFFNLASNEEVTAFRPTLSHTFVLTNTSRLFFFGFDRWNFLKSATLPFYANPIEYNWKKSLMDLGLIDSSYTISRIWDTETDLFLEAIKGDRISKIYAVRGQTTFSSSMDFLPFELYSGNAIAKLFPSSYLNSFSFVSYNGDICTYTDGKQGLTGLPIRETGSKLRCLWGWEGFMQRKIIKIVSGQNTNVLITNHGEVYAWGYWGKKKNPFFPAGDGDIIYSTPTLVQGLAKVFVVDVIIGGDLASIFYRKIDGSIEKIPSFLDTTVDSTWFNQLAAWGLVRSDISQIAIGSSHRLYLFRSANKVYGEGENNRGQRGDGSTSTSVTPTELLRTDISGPGVPRLEQITFIHGGQDHSLVATRYFQKPLCYGISNTDFRVCSAHGNCINEDQCLCYNGFSGDRCEISYTCNGRSNADPDVCSRNGICEATDKCSCFKGYTGQNCELSTCFGKSPTDPTVCSGKGTCNLANVCTCNVDYYGADCSIFAPQRKSFLFSAGDTNLLGIQKDGTDEKTKITSNEISAVSGLPFYGGEGIADFSVTTSHAILSTTRQRVFSFGENFRSSLGLSQQNELIYQDSPAPLGIFYHFHVLDETNPNQFTRIGHQPVGYRLLDVQTKRRNSHIITAGYNDNNFVHLQIGEQSFMNSFLYTAPTCIAGLSKFGKQLSAYNSVKMGNDFTVYYNQESYKYAIALTSSKQMGIISLIEFTLNAPKHEHVYKVCVANNVVFLLSTNGRLFSQQVVGPVDDKLIDRPMSGLSALFQPGQTLFSQAYDKMIVDVSCSSENVMIRLSKNDEMYAWGDSFYNSLGFKGIVAPLYTTRSPRKVDIFEESLGLFFYAEKIVQFVNEQHSLFLTTRGRVFFLGPNTARQACFQNEVACTSMAYHTFPYEIKLNAKVALPTNTKINFLAASHDNSFIGRMENVVVDPVCFGYPAAFSAAVCSGKGTCMELDTCRCESMFSTFPNIYWGAQCEINFADYYNYALIAGVFFVSVLSVLVLFLCVLLLCCVLCVSSVFVLLAGLFVKKQLSPGVNRGGFGDQKLIVRRNYAKNVSVSKLSEKFMDEVDIDADNNRQITNSDNFML